MKSKLLPIKPDAWPTTKQRFSLRKMGDSFVRFQNVLQQWWWDGLRGEWRDVEHHIEPMT